MKKMIQAIEEIKLTVMIKVTDKNNDRVKMNLPLTPSTPVTVFLISKKLLRLRTLKL